MPAVPGTRDARARLAIRHATRGQRGRRRSRPGPGRCRSRRSAPWRGSRPAGLAVESRWKTSARSASSPRERLRREHREPVVDEAHVRRGLALVVEHAAVGEAGVAGVPAAAVLSTVIRRVVAARGALHRAVVDAQVGVAVEDEEALAEVGQGARTAPAVPASRRAGRSGSAARARSARRRRAPPRCARRGSRRRARPGARRASRSSASWCSRKGRPATSISGLGVSRTRSPRRVPSPPARMQTGARLTRR